MLSLLDKGRVDVAILDRVMGEWTFRQLGLDLVINQPPLVSRENYIYLHKKHSRLLPAFTRVLQEMKRDGSYDEIFARATGPG